MSHLDRRIAGPLSLPLLPLRDGGSLASDPYVDPWGRLILVQVSGSVVPWQRNPIPVTHPRITHGTRPTASTAGITATHPENQ